MELLGYSIPPLLLIIGVLIAIGICWFILKFAIKIFMILILFFVILIGLDILGVFTWIQENILIHFL